MGRDSSPSPDAVQGPHRTIAGELADVTDRPLAERRADIRCAWRLVGVLALLFLLTSAGRLTSVDGAAMYQTAYQLISAGQVAVPPSSEAPAGRDGRHYAKYGIGLSLVELPLVLFGHALVEVTGQPDDRLTQFWASLTNSFVSIGIVLVWWRFARDLGYSRPVSTAGAVTLASGSLLWPYARTDFSEPLLALGLLLTAWCLHRWQLANQRSWLWATAAGAGLGFAFLTKPTSAVLFPAYAVYAFWLLGRRRDRCPRQPSRKLAVDSAAAAGPLLVAGGFVLAFNYYRFGSVLDLGYGDEPIIGFTTPLVTGAGLLLASSGKGLLWFCPAVVAGLWGWRSFARTHSPQSALAVLLLVSQLAFFGRWWAWHGDWSWGPRYLVAVVPFIMWGWLPLWGQVLQSPRSRLAAAVVAVGVASGVGVNALGVLIDYGAYYSVVGHQLGQGEDVADARTKPVFSPLAGHWWLLRASLYDSFSEADDALANPYLHAYPWAEAYPERVPPHPEYALMMDLWFTGPVDRPEWVEFVSALVAWWLLVALIPAGRSLWVAAHRADARDVLRPSVARPLSSWRESR
ncbi:MAG: hypothetical protein CL878_08575 [Dehalococcoidia bacterium]|nr:hypothetical protein [Dehalococcoidia bacterium]